MATADRIKWNEKYRQKLQERLCPPPPNETLLGIVSSYLTGGSCLDLACGLGGNSFYLAKHGYQVTAVDVSDVALDFIQEKATDHGLSILTQQQDLDQIQLQEEAYDLVIVTYFLDRKLFPSLKQAVKKEGLLFMETFYQEDHAPPEMNPAFKLKTDELRTEFDDWSILYWNQAKGIQSILGRKPH
ncbi:methyltransferase domain-containing protein [Ammoniphilus sp. YIM 78166]|uniref:methyltransferase domain-containing protein n=1 Tax=Ammoniphilus sp. YIM 78166 TaxID=1644106 RepID=UPI00106F5A81|nr:methyltransferase domain-containing protein [Ammoniphilus sp. YIM 78166]